MSTSFRSIILSGGNKCFVRCPGCYNYFSTKDYNTESLIDFIREMKESANINKITMAGGEPLVREDMGYILQNLKQLGLVINRYPF